MNKWARPRSSESWAGEPLSRPPDDADLLQYRVSLASVREFTADRARRAGLAPRRVSDLVMAVCELTANTLAHTSGPGDTDDVGHR